MEVKTILEIKGTTIFYVKPEAPISEAIELMHKERIGSVLVMENEKGQVLGMLTERDIIRIIAEGSSDVLKGAVADVMSRDVVACTTDCTLNSIISGMTKYNVRHIPVYDDDKLHGMISARDVLQFRIKQLESGEESRFDRWFAKGEVYPLNN